MVVHCGASEGVWQSDGLPQSSGLGEPGVAPSPELWCILPPARRRRHPSDYLLVEELVESQDPFHIEPMPFHVFILAVGAAMSLADFWALGIPVSAAYKVRKRYIYIYIYPYAPARPDL